MYHPAELTIVHRDDRNRSDSFVGVCRGADGKPQFVLPYGFDDFPVAEPSAVSRMFFGLYRALRYYRRVQSRYRSSEQDGSLQDEGGFRIETKEGETAALYSSIPMLEAVIEGYDELRIASILYRQRRTERIDYSQIHRYLHEAVFLDDHTAFIDEMVLPNPVLTLDATALVQMFCFVYGEIKRALGESVAPEVTAQAGAFKSRHLAPDSYLFEDVEGHARTIDLLKEKLYEVDRQTKFKDQDYWHFYDAVEAFLYGEPSESDDGVYWGVTSFSLIWEDMCLVWVHENLWEGVRYADTARYANNSIGGHRVFVNTAFDPPFYFEMGNKKRYLRPDLVRYNHNEGRWKYLDALFDVEKRGSGVRITLTRSDEQALLWFKALRRRVRRHGFRQPPLSRRGGTFPGVRPEDVAKAINEMSEGSNSQDSWLVTDFKCVPWKIYSGPWLGAKATRDVLKQVTYEYALQIYAEDTGAAVKTASQLCIPYYFRKLPEDDIGAACEDEWLDSSLVDQGIEVFRADMSQVLETYLLAEEQDTA